jgi:hypothetical protein
VFTSGKLSGYKKILVLYTNYGKQRKPEKTNWVMHQYHLGSDEEEKDGELVVSKVFYQTQPRQCGTVSSTARNAVPLAASATTGHHHHHDGGNGGDDENSMLMKDVGTVDFYSRGALIGYNQTAPNNGAAASATVGAAGYEVHTTGLFG